MNTIHYDVVIYTKDIQKGITKIKELMKENNEELFKATSEVKYIGEKRTYIIIPNYENTREIRYYEAYIDNKIDPVIATYCIYPYCLPYTDNWRERIHSL